MNRKYDNKAAGFTMIEMLVALLILSVGLLGIAALQTTGQRATYQAYVRTQATWLAYEMMDKMRNNNTVLDNYLSGNQTVTSPNTECDDNTCSLDQLAKYDLDNWFYRINDALPMGEGEIAAVGGVENQYIISLSWLDRQQQGDDGQVITQSWMLQL